MPSSTVHDGEQRQFQGDEEDLKNHPDPDDRRHRYENLKNSVAVLRSRVRSTPTATPCPSSPSCLHTDLVPYSNSYFSSVSSPAPAPAPAGCTTVSDRSRSSCFNNQIEACSLLESYAMQALRLDCETRLKEGRDELEKAREKLRDKVRRTEMFDRALEKQRRKLEARIEFFSERCKTLEMQLAEQSMRHKEELWAQSRAFSASREEEEEDRRLQTNKMISNYDDTVATLKENNEMQLAEIQRLKSELNIRLEQMEKTKHSTEDQIKNLDGQLKAVIQQSETFKMSYEEQEREWNKKLQHITAMHQYQTKTLSEDFAFQIGKLRQEMKQERDQQDVKLQAYKTQKLADMENVEKRVKGVLEMKDSTIAQLKLELKMLQHQVSASVSMLDENTDENCDTQL